MTRYTDPALVAKLRNEYPNKGIRTLASENHLSPRSIRDILVAEGVEIRERGRNVGPLSDPRTPAMGQFGQTLRILRGKRKLSKVTAELNIAVPTLSRIEHGERCPRLFLLLDLAELYGVEDSAELLELVRLLARAQQEQEDLSRRSIGPRDRTPTR